jgi:hypothetical protein
MKKFLGVGINLFQDPSSNLQGCVNDMQNVEHLVLNSNLGFKLDDTRTLQDSQASRLGIYRQLDWCTKDWANPTPQTDFLILQASCHGTEYAVSGSNEKDQALCSWDYPELWDSPQGAPDAEECAKLLGRPPLPEICDKDLAIFLKRIPEGVYTILLVDACHSGTISRELQSRHRPKFIAPPAKLDNPFLPIRHFGRKKGILSHWLNNSNVHYLEQNHILLSGCKDAQTSADADIDGMHQGAMTWAFLTALKKLGWPSTTAPTWVQVHATMLDLLRSGGYEQIPQLTGPQRWLDAPIFGGTT